MASKKKKRKSLTRKIEIPYQNYDIVFKSLTHVFKGNVLEHLGVRIAPVVRAVPTDLQQIKLKSRGMDFVFLLEDGTYLHAEFQTKASEEDLHRFKEYDVALYDRVQELIHTAVIYGAGIEKATEYLNCGSVKYETIAVYLNDHDGETTYNDLLEKITKFVQLNEFDQLNLVLLPLMGKVKNRSAMAVDALKLASKLENNTRKRYLMGCLIGISDKFLDDKYVESFMEVLNMTRVFQSLYTKGWDEGKKEGRIENFHDTMRKFLERKFGPRSSALQQNVGKMTELEVLDFVLEELFAVSTLEEAKAVINDGIKSSSSKQ